jgi:precorrin-6A/cobalt-precorrin-6A reductase
MLDRCSCVLDKADMRILILGGTTEASALAGACGKASGLDAVLSFAGRTGDPKRGPTTTRVGGFGGVEGLVRYLAEARIDAVIDATHPFAAQISRNAAAACADRGVPILAIRRPVWARGDGDRWSEVATMAEAAAALGSAPRRVFLTVGRLELAPFAAAPQHHYLVRTIEPIGDVFKAPHVVALQARGPFDEAAERALIAAHGIEILVTKNSGGAATYGKIAAARALKIPVVVVSRPAKPDVPFVESAGEAMDWIRSHGRAP